MAAVESEVATPPESSDRELSLRETIEAARDEVISRQQEPETPEPEPKEPTNDGRPRDDRGRFVSGVPKEETPAVVEPAPTAPSQEGAGPAAAAPPTQDFIPAPNAWTNQEKALWKDIPTAARQAIARREADIHKEFTRRDNDVTFSREFQRIAQPYEPVLRQLGATPLQAVQSLMQSLWTLTTADPVTRSQFIQNLARQYGAQIPSGEPQGQQQQQLPAQLQQYIAQQNQAIQQLQQQQAQFVQAQENAEKAQLHGEIQAFQSDPSHTFFPHVVDDMIQLLERGAAESLKDAYDIAVYRRPDLREQLFTQQAQPQQRQARTQAARAKAGSVRGGPGTSADVPFKSDGSIRGDLQAAFREVTGRE